MRHVTEADARGGPGRPRRRRGPRAHGGIRLHRARRPRPRRRRPGGPRRPGEPLARVLVVAASHPYWRPLVTASYVLDAQWGGARPLAYHATNVVLHAAASALVLALLRRFGVGRGLALAGALAFAVHPALASAVAWIPGR